MADERKNSTLLNPIEKVQEAGRATGRAINEAVHGVQGAVQDGGRAVHGAVQGVVQDGGRAVHGVVQDTRDAVQDAVQGTGQMVHATMHKAISPIHQKVSCTWGGDDEMHHGHTARVSSRSGSGRLRKRDQKIMSGHRGMRRQMTFSRSRGSRVRPGSPNVHKNSSAFVSASPTNLAAPRRHARCRSRSAAGILPLANCRGDAPFCRVRRSTWTASRG
eukprot:2398616-Prymnesium_polylepis.1